MSNSTVGTFWLKFVSPSSLKLNLICTPLYYSWRDEYSGMHNSISPKIDFHLVSFDTIQLSSVLSSSPLIAAKIPPPAILLFLWMPSWLPHCSLIQQQQLSSLYRNGDLTLFCDKGVPAEAEAAACCLVCTAWFCVCMAITFDQGDTAELLTCSVLISASYNKGDPWKHIND